MKIREMQDEILRLKKENDICILAHSYQAHEIVEIADFTGDSYALSKLAATVPNKTVLMCGPPIMIKFTLQGLIELGFTKEQIYTTMELRMKCG